jgi:hypothetical protein
MAEVRTMSYSRLFGALIVAAVAMAAARLYVTSQTTTEKVEQKAKAAAQNTKRGSATGG